MYLVYIRLLKARKHNEKRMNSLQTCIDMLPSTQSQNQKHLNSTTATHPLIQLHCLNYCLFCKMNHSGATYGSFSEKKLPNWYEDKSLS